MRKIYIVITIVLISLIYYQFGYKRYFIYNVTKEKCVTIWPTWGNNCYVIPGKYFSPFTPDTNFIKTINNTNYIGVIWNTGDEYDFKLSFYNDFEISGLDDNIKVYANNDSLLWEYKILDSINVDKGIRTTNNMSDSIKKKFDYNYIDLNRIYGIKIFR
jgi:hypothetical protein